ncbi:MAG: glycosyltransferase family 2 protein [Desulfofustis sp.]|nr:glycosyltransferase family 2 protein [Desulfofustis sp.]
MEKDDVAIPKVTLGFISCERLHYLRATLESARLCIKYPDLEWIIVDDDSEEPGLREYIQKCDWLEKKIFKRQSHAEAMNQLVDQAAGEYILIWPDDVQFITSGDWLEELINILELNPDIGGVGLDAQRLCTLNRIVEPTWREKVSRLYAEVRRFGWQKRRRQRKITSSGGFSLWTYGSLGDGVVGSWIPSLTRTSIWRELGSWRVAKPDARLIDSSLGAEDDMIERVRERGIRLQLALPQVPLAADIINDEIGCKAKVRKGIRYGNYTPPPGGGDLYYEISSYEERSAASRQDRPLSFSECVVPIGFEIPTDALGDRLKESFNAYPCFKVRGGVKPKEAL